MQAASTSKYNYDCSLMNAVYLSERWAFEDLLRFKNTYPNLWTNDREEQLQDEARHYKMCLAALKEENFVVNHDLKFSMQERLYSNLYSFDHQSRLDFLNGAHYVFEKRAIWVFKTYQKIGHNDKFKKIFSIILKDEHSHNIQLKPFSKLPPGLKLLEADRQIWHSILPQKFGSKIFSSVDLWNWYYEESGL